MKQIFPPVTFVASLGFGLVQLDVSIVNVALVSFARALHASTVGVAWIVDAYAIAFACLLMAGGALGDRIGAKRTFLGGIAIFGVASLGCGVAPNLAVLIVMRVIQGVGAASLVPCSLALIANAARDDAKNRAHAVAWWTAAGSISLALGPIVGGALLATAGWRAIFLINLPICAGALWLTHRFAAETTPRAGRFDPMISLGFFRDATFSAAVFAGFAINASLYGTLFALGIYWQRECGYAPLGVGFAFVPFAVALGIANICAGRFIAKCGPRVPLIGGLSLAFSGFVALLLCGATTPYLTLLPALLVIPSGVGVAVPAMTSALLATVPRDHSGIASGVLNTVRQAAGALGVATRAALITRFGVISGLHSAILMWLLAIGLAIAVAAVGLGRKAPHTVLAAQSLRDARRCALRDVTLK